MRLEQSFEVSAPVERVWEALIDVERVAPCLPGAAITGRNDDGTYDGTFTIKIGPTTASYTGKLEMDLVDESARSATMRAQGSDKRGQGGAKATIVSKLTPAGEVATRVEVDTDYSITGRLARFGRGGMIEDISERLLKEFAARLQASLASEPEPPPPPPPDEPAPLAPEGPPPVERRAPPEPGDAPEPPPVDAPPPTHTRVDPEPIQGVSLVGSVLLGRIRRNPLPLVAGLVALLVLRRRRRR